MMGGKMKQFGFDTRMGGYNLGRIERWRQVLSGGGSTSRLIQLNLAKPVVVRTKCLPMSTLIVHCSLSNAIDLICF